MVKRLTAEIVGTFILTFMGCGAIVADTVNNASGGGHSHGLIGVMLTFSITLMTIAYGLGDVSGGHFNPAVTVGLVTAKRFEIKDAIPYILAQIVGAFAAALLLKSIYAGQTLGAGGWGEGTLAKNVEILPGFLLEMMGTFMLVFTVLNVTAGTKDKALAGLCIGASLGVGIFLTGNATNAPLNPARELGPAVVAGNFKELWLFLTAPIAGGILAAVVTLVVRSEEK